MDITYIPMERGFVYLAVVLDRFTVACCRERVDYHGEWDLVSRRAETHSLATASGDSTRD